MLSRTLKTTIAVSMLLLTGSAAVACAGSATAPGSGDVSLVDVKPAGIGPEDGYIESKALSPFADNEPAIANLDPALREAMQNAATAAMGDGIDFVVTSGWRSAFYQQFLLDKAVRDYGSVEVAGEYVLAPNASKHVTGEAVDIGRTDANSWLSQHGAAYGLCQTYANEMWHFELATTAGGQCPEQLRNASAG